MEHHHLPSLIGLLLVLLFTLPPLIRAFLLLHPGLYRWIHLAAWMILPGLINEGMIKLLNQWLDSPWAAKNLVAGIPTLVAMWTLVCTFLSAILWKHLNRALHT
jgi:hypothetical protein